MKHSMNQNMNKKNIEYSVFIDIGSWICLKTLIAVVVYLIVTIY